MQRRALASVCAVLFLTFLDNTVISVALADIQTTLRPGIQALQWIVDAYMLAFAALMLAGGTLGDLVGRKRVMLAGVAVFMAGSVVSALAANSATLISGRVIMGVGAAASEPGTLSVLRHIFPDRGARARALAAWTAVSASALALGPVIGGLIIAAGGWRDVFWFNAAFGLLAFGAAAVTVPETADPHGRSLDGAGLVFGATAITASTFAIIEGETAGYATWWIAGLLALGAVTVAAFVGRERRSSDPVLPLAYFRNGPFTAGNVVAFAANWGVLAVFFFTAFYLQLIAGLTPATIALAFAGMTAAMWVAAALASVWTARSGPGASMTVGCALAGGGLLLVNAVLEPNISVGALACVLALTGFGFGMAFVGMTAAVLTAAPAERSGTAGSTVNTCRELGGVFAVAILGAILNAQITGGLSRKLAALGIPATFRSIVIDAVTHGGVPKSVSPSAAGGAAHGHAKLVQQVIAAAENAFAGGLHMALPIAAGLLLLAALGPLAVGGARRRASHRARSPRASVY